MFKQSLFQSRYSWLYVTAYLTLIIVTVIELPRVGAPNIRWVMAALLAAFGLILAARHIWIDSLPVYRPGRRQTNLYVVVQWLLIAGLLALRQVDLAGATKDHALTIPLLFCILSVQAVPALTLRPAIAWIGLFTATTALLFCNTQGWQQGVFNSIPYTIGFIFSGAFAYGLNKAEAAQRESQILLEELRHTYRQLQEYAAKAEELAVSEERNRLAREMHDALGHRLTVSAVQLEGAQRLIESNPQRAGYMMSTVREQVLEALSELRRTVATLRTPLEEDLSLPKALARLAANFEEATGITIHPTLPDEAPNLPDAHRLGLYRMAQEALTNIQRHAQAKEAWLEFSLQDGFATLLVKDNGVGLPQNALKTGFGLRGLQERAVQLGGKLLLESEPNGGTQVSLNLPLPGEAAGG